MNDRVLEAVRLPIKGVETTTAAFVGLTERGAVDEPTVVTSWEEYQQHFGGFGWMAHTPFAVYSFFQEGGTKATVVRTSAGKGAQAGAVVGGIHFAAVTPGPWGNALHVRVRARAEGENPSPNGAEAEAEAEAEGGTFDVEVLVDVATLEGTTVGEAVDPSRRLLAAFVERNSLGRLDDGERIFTVLESFTGLSETTMVEEIDGRSLFVRVLDPGTEAPRSEGPTVLDGGRQVDEFLSASVINLRDETEISLLAAPDSVLRVDEGPRGGFEGQAGLVAQISRLCEARRDLFYVADPPPGLGVDEVVGLRRGEGETPRLRSSFAAMYYPWLWVTDPVRAVQVLVPPSGVVLGRTVHADITAGVYKAAAGTSRGKLGDTVAGLERAVSDTDQERLNPAGIDAIRDLPHHGLVIWAARTLADEEPWLYVNMRRTAIWVEQSVIRGLRWATFETNDETLWPKVIEDVTVFLTALWQRGGLVGGTADEAFVVTCDAELNPPMGRKKKQNPLRIDLELALMRPREYAKLELSLPMAPPREG